MKKQLASLAQPVWVLASFLLLLLISSPASATPYQKVTCSFPSSNATCVLPNPVQSGDLLVIVLHSWHTPRISDALSSSWSQATALNNSSIWYTVLSASGSDSVSIGTGGSGELSEYSGFSSLDASASQANIVGTTAISSGSATTTMPGDLIIGAMFGSGWSGIQPGPGFSVEAAFAEQAEEDQVQSAAGAVSATFTQPGWGSASTVLMAAFKDPKSTTKLDISAYWEDGSPVSAQVIFAQPNLGAPPTVLLTENLVNGTSPSITGTLAPNTTYTVTLTCEGDTTGTCSNGTSLYQFPFTTIMINPANLRSGVIGLVFRKKDMSLKSAQVNVGMAF